MFDPAANVAAYAPIFNEAALNAGRAARQNALADISQQYLTDPEGAQNALIARGWWDDANTMQKRTDANNLAAAYQTAADNAPKNQNPGITALMRAGNPGGAGTIQNIYNAQANQAKTAAEQAADAEKNVFANFGNIVRIPNLTPEQWNASLDMAKQYHPQLADRIEQYRDFNTGLPMMRGQLNVKPSDVTVDGDAKYGMVPQYYIDGKGELRIGQLSSSGGLRPVDVPGRVAPSLAIKDTGTAQTAIDTRTGQPVSSVAKSVEEAARLKERGEATGKFEGEKPAKFVKASQAIGDLERAHSLVQQDIDRAIDSIENGAIPKTGMFAIARVVPGTSAHNLAEILKGIKANISFDKLQAMRESSPTGGALGQVSDFENKLLQATSGSLEQDQTGEQLLTHLKRLKEQLGQLGAQRRAAFERDFADVIKSSGAAPGAPKSGIEARAVHEGKNYYRSNGQWYEERK